MESSEIQLQEDALKEAIKLLPLPEHPPGAMRYVDTLPFKYARYYIWFLPEQRSYTADQMKRLKRIQKNLKKIAGELKELPAEIFCETAQNFNFRLGLGIYICATESLDAAIAKTMAGAPELKKGRPQNPYQELVNELGRDYQLVTGRIPSIAYDPYRGGPSGDFYFFVDAVFSALALQGSGNIEHLIRSMDKDLTLPNGWA